MNGPGICRAYLSFLAVYWMTAPLAWLYGVPYEQFLSRWTQSTPISGHWRWSRCGVSPSWFGSPWSSSIPIAVALSLVMLVADTAASSRSRGRAAAGDPRHGRNQSRTECDRMVRTSRTTRVRDHIAALDHRGRSRSLLSPWLRRLESRGDLAAIRETAAVPWHSPRSRFWRGLPRCPSRSRSRCSLTELIEAIGVPAR